MKFIWRSVWTGMQLNLIFSSNSSEVRSGGSSTRFVHGRARGGQQCIFDYF